MNNFVLSSFFKTLKRNRVLTLFLVLIVISNSIAVLLPAQIMKRLIDNYLKVGFEKKILLFAVYFLLVNAALVLAEVLKEIILLIMGQRISKALRIGLSEKIQHLPSTYFHYHPTGTVSSILTNDVDYVFLLFSSGLFSMIIDIFKVVSIIIMIFIFNLVLGFILLGLVPIIFFITRVFNRIVLKYQLKAKKTIASINNEVAESHKNINLIKGFNLLDHRKQRFQQNLTNNYHAVIKVNYYDSLFPCIIQTIRGLIIIIVIILSASYFNAPLFSLGVLAASIDLVTRLMTPLEAIAMEFQTIQDSLSSIKRVNAFYRQENEERNYYQITSSDLFKSSEIRIIFQDVCFGYPDNEEIIHNLNLEIKNNDKVTFIGRSGAGKTTIMNLLAGLYKPNKGTITINGYSTYSIPEDIKEKTFGYVVNDLFDSNSTLREIVTFYDSTIKEEQILQALDYVFLLSRIASTEHRLDTPLIDFAFSSGELQLLAIARAILFNPPILLFDEVTSALDAITEKHLIAVINRLSENRIIISISHKNTSYIKNNAVYSLKDKVLSKIT